MSNKQRPRHGAYLADVVNLHQSGRLPLIPGMIGIIDILHDHDCPRPQGGQCRCQAEVGEVVFPRVDPSPDEAA